MNKFFRNKSLGLLDKLSPVMSDKAFIRCKYFLIMGKRLHLKPPRTFNEKIQFLKLNDRKDIYTTLADKINMKEYILPIVGKEHIIPTLGVWEKSDEVNFEDLPEQFAIKCSHDSGSVIICRDKNSFDIDSARKSLSESLSHNHFNQSREWCYKNIVPRILAEPYLGDGLADYKFFCFGGKVEFLYYSIGLEDHKSARMAFISKNWTMLPFRRTDFIPLETLPVRPRSFDRMIALAETLSQGMKFVRVDLYEIDGVPKVSELTFYPNGGMMPFESAETDLEIGNLLKL